jgi:hypothetical protein
MPPLHAASISYHWERWLPAGIRRSEAAAENPQRAFRIRQKFG